MFKFAEIKTVVNSHQITTNDYIMAYNSLVSNEKKIICASTDSYLFDSFYTISDLVDAIQRDHPSIKDSDIIKAFEEIGGDRFDIPSVYHLIVKRLLDKEV